MTCSKRSDPFNILEFRFLEIHLSKYGNSASVSNSVDQLVKTLGGDGGTAGVDVGPWLQGSEELVELVWVQMSETELVATGLGSVATLGPTADWSIWLCGHIAAIALRARVVTESAGRMTVGFCWAQPRLLHPALG